MIWFIGSRLINVFGGLGSNIGSFINSLLNIIQNILNYVYSFYQNIWMKFYENPYGFITFLANIWVLMC